jgi:hypothetical protein
MRNGTVSARIDELQNENAAQRSLRLPPSAPKMRQERISSLQQRIDGYNERRQRLLAVIGERAVAGWDAPGASTGLLVRRERSIGSGANQKFVAEYEVDTGLLRELRELEKQAAIDLGQWTEKRDVKMDAQVSQKSDILAAHFTLGELERMMDVAVKAAEAQAQQRQQPQPVRQGDAKIRRQPNRGARCIGKDMLDAIN